MSLEQAVVQLEQTNSKLQEEVVRFRDAAMGLNAVYSTITEGRQNTADGKYFSVPGNGAYMRLYRRQGSSSELIAEFPDRDELNSVIDQLGPLLGRGVVGGGEDLMTVGAFGLGAPTTSFTAHFNDYITPGFYSFESVSNNTSNCPLSSAYGTLLVYRRQSADQLMQEYNSILGGGRRYFRILSSSGWSSWSEVYHQKTILGTVSQSDGVPTGRLIERGSNSSGEYVKFADGTAICTIERTLGSVIFAGDGTASSPYRTDSVDGSWPLSFTTTPTISMSFFPEATEFSSTRHVYMGGIRSMSSRSYFSFRAVRPGEISSGDNQITGRLVAIGRWY